MPLTPLQRDVIGLLSARRTEDSHFAGGVVLHAMENSSRYSDDLDIFHDAEAEVARASDGDMSGLRAAGFEVHEVSGDWHKPSGFRKARVVRHGEELEIDWATDSAFRFFPVQRDPILGWRLHLFDIATNKALALASRSVTRDLVDIVDLDKVYPLEAIAWAACGKDAGFSPMLLLDMMRRFARIHPTQLAAMQAREKVVEDYTARVLESLREAADHAGKCGVKLGIENREHYEAEIGRAHV